MGPRGVELPAALASEDSRRCPPSRHTSAAGVHHTRLRDQAGPVWRTCYFDGNLAPERGHGPLYNLVEAFDHRGQVVGEYFVVGAGYLGQQQLLDFHLWLSWRARRLLLWVRCQ